MYKKFKISIIITVHNTKFYLSEAIDSVVGQSLGFEDNVQLILVDDGSTDGSLDIIREYEKKYPDNIIVLSQENMGQATARNNGLNYVQGKYVNFLDSDDYLSENTLKEVYNFFEKHEHKTDIVSIPMVFFEREEGDHFLNYKFEKGNRVIDLVKEPNNPQLSLSSSFIKYTSLKGMTFDSNLMLSENSYPINKILLNKKTLGVLSSAKYYYRKRDNLSSMMDNDEIKASYYIHELNSVYPKLIDYCMSNYGKVSDFIQFGFIHELQLILSYFKTKVFDDEKTEKLVYSLSYLVSYINDDIIILNKTLNPEFKNCLLYLKGKSVHVENVTNDILLKVDDYTIDTLNNHELKINKVDFNEDDVILFCSFESYFDINHISLELIQESGKLSFKHENTLNYRDINFLSQTRHFKHNFSIKIPVFGLEEDLKFKVKINYHNVVNETNLISSYLNINFGKSNVKNVFGTSKKVLLNKDSIIISKSYLFSVVMAIFNTEAYLSEAIDSVVGQSLGFEDNVQLILVDDGSTDGSLDIIREYEKKYPDNIIVLSQENMGQATARNNGLNYVQGKYVNFLDSDDYLSENTLKEVYNFFEKHENETDIVSIPITMFGRMNSPHILNYKFDKGNCVIDLVEEPNNPQLSASSSFIKYESIKNVKFPTTIVGSEDAHFVNKILLEKKTLGLVETAEYFYRRHNDLSSTLDSMISRKEFYNDRLKHHFMELISYSLFNEKTVPKFIQYTLAYDLQWLLKKPDIEILDTKDELDEFWYCVKYIVSFFEYNVIMENRNVSNGLFKQYFLYLKTNDLTNETKNNDVFLRIGDHQIDRFKSHKLWLDIIELKDNNLNISGFFNSHFDTKNISIEAIKKLENGTVEKYVSKQVEYTTRQNLTYLSKTWQYKYNFDIKIPLMEVEHSEIKLRINYHKNGNKMDYSENNLISAYLTLDFQKNIRISRTSIYQVKDSHLVLFKNNSFYIMPYSYKSILRYEYSIFKKIWHDKKYGYKEALLLRSIYLACYPIIRLRNTQIYLFMDRPDQADDNGEALFKYALHKKDKVKKYFVVEKESPDYARLSKLGTVLSYKSFKHKILYILASKIITAHPDESVLNPFYSYNKKEDEREIFAGLITASVYFLQHGVTKDNISTYLKKYDKNLSLILTVSDEEHDSFLDKGYCYDESIIQTLGFPRHDTLKNNPKKQILITPTWRNFLEGNRNLFKNSNYFLNINNLLSSDEFVKMANENGYEIIFRPHPRLTHYIGSTDEKYVDLFDINDKIKVSTDESYQKLFEESSVLITDYSSVAFDFAYLKKPVIYCHPDEDYHHAKSYFDYETMGFGDVVENSDDLLNKIHEYLLTDCEMEDKYKKRVENFFKFHDKNNSKRVYDWIKKH